MTHTSEDRRERPQPYVGVSGVVTPQMQEDVERVAYQVGLTRTDRMLALGVKAVHKTQFLDVANKYGPEWYPVGEQDFAGALWPRHADDPSFGVAQAYLDVDHVADPAYRNEFTARIVQRGAPWIRGIQFDLLPWHDDPQMLEFLEQVKADSGLKVFLQCHRDAMQELGPKGVARRLGHTAGSIDYLLFDASHGTGKRLNTARLEPFLEEAHSTAALDTVGMAIAGGIDAAVVREELPALVEKYPGLSWDSEGKLHPVNEGGRRPLDVGVTLDYLLASVGVLHKPDAPDWSNV